MEYKDNLSRPDSSFETKNQATSNDKKKNKEKEPKPDPVYKPRGGESVTRPTYTIPKRDVDAFIKGVKKQKETGKSPW